MKLLSILAICVWVLISCTSCIFNNDDNNSDTQDYYLRGAIKDAGGNIITDASVYILFNDMWEDVPGKNNTNSLPTIQDVLYKNRLHYNGKTLNTTTKLCISSAYLGEVRTIITENHSLTWDGKDNDGNVVCNGVYSYVLTTYNDADSVLSSDTGDIMFNDETMSNRPAVVSSISGYRIPLKKYFQFGKQLTLFDESGNVIRNYTINGNFEIFVKKAGYHTVSKHVSLSSYNKNHVEDFVMNPLVR